MLMKFRYLSAGRILGWHLAGNGYGFQTLQRICHQNPDKTRLPAVSPLA
jgi:hypothetical protein